MTTKFNVWRGEPLPKKEGLVVQFYAHMTLGNGRIVWASEGYDDVRSAHKTCASTWNSIAKDLGVEAVPMVPYSKGSLLPKVKRKT